MASNKGQDHLPAWEDIVDFMRDLSRGKERGEVNGLAFKGKTFSRIQYDAVVGMIEYYRKGQSRGSA